MTEPIQIKSKLAGNPSGDPHFKTQVQDSKGRQIAAADPTATRALISLMDMNAVLGGAASHYGGPAALAELMSALHAFVFDQARQQKKQWHELYNIVNDAGHCENGLYALKANYGMAGLDFNSLKKFRSIESPLTGHGEVHCFPEGVLISNGPLGSAFPQAQGLAMGDKLAERSRVTVGIISDGASMEGEAKEAFAAIPGLAKAGKLAPFVAIISDNNTKLSGRIDAESFSMAPTFEGFKALGWKVIALEQGNDLQKCFNAIAEAIEFAKNNPHTPVAVHAKTVKGIGTQKTADSASGGHGFPLKSPTELAAFLSEICGGGELQSLYGDWIKELGKQEEEIKAKGGGEGGEKIQNGVSAALVRARKEGLPIVSVTSDLPGSTGVAGFRKEFPKDSLDVGVAESNMVSTAAGLSKAGYIPVVDTFAQFGVTKGALPFIMSSLSEAPMIAIFSHTGFQDAADGASHQALSYMAMTCSIPHVNVVCLSCSEEADALVYQAVKEFADARRAGKVPPTTVFFLGRENFPKNYGQTNFRLGDAQILRDTSAGKKQSVALVTHGSMVPEAIKAVAKMEAAGIGCVLVNLSSVNKMDAKTLDKAVASAGGNVITLEDHQVVGGMGQMVAQALMQKRRTLRMKNLGVHGEFGQSAYTALDLYRKHGMDSDSIVKAAQEILKD